MSKIESVSTAQGTVHRIHELSFDRKSLNAQIKAQNEQLMDYIESVGEVLIHDREDKPRMYSVIRKPRTRLNRKALAEHINMNLPSNGQLKVRDLTVTKIAELVNERIVDADTIAGFEEHDTVRRIKKRRANKEEIKRFAEVK